MNAYTLKTRLALIAFSFLFTTSFAQVQIDTDVNAVEMVEHFIGPGVPVFDNVTYAGADEARGLFSNGYYAIEMESGVFLCTGDGNFIPGPNSSGISGIDNGSPGDSSLNLLSTEPTYNASVLEFDFIPVNDTLRFWYSFGSEDYNESVTTMWNDLCAAFITGPNPAGGVYANKNIAIIPGTTSKVSINTLNNGWADIGVVPTGPCMNCQYYWDNTGGLELEYDGRTVVLVGWILVVPYEEYHLKIAVADVAGPGKDSGIFLKEYSLFSPGPADFTSFHFLTADNPDLPFDVTGVISGQTIYLAVPANTDITNLVASFTGSGAYARVNGVLQHSSVTANDFSNPLVYELQGHDIKNWTVNVEIVVDIPQVDFTGVTISPNPSRGSVILNNINGCQITVNDLQGRIVETLVASNTENSVIIDRLQPGIYLLRLEKEGFSSTRKVIIE